MPANRYPRVNEVIAPSVLREVLDLQVDGRLRAAVGQTRLNSFDAASWQRYPEAVCLLAADAVVQAVRAALAGRAPKLLGLRMPAVSGRADGLRVGNRALNVLTREGFSDDLSRLASLTVAEVEKFAGFGGRSLVDLLCGLEELREEPAEVARSEAADEPEGEPPASDWSRWVASDDPDVPEWLAAMPIPPLPEGLTLKALRLDYRVANALRGGPFGRRPWMLSGFLIAELLTLPGFGTSCLRRLLRGIDRLREPPAAGPVSVEEELAEWADAARFGSADSERRRHLFARYHGLDGAPATLAELGQEFGLTKERVRQLLLILDGASRPSPLLDRALQVMARMAPATEDAVLDELERLGLTRRRVPLAALASVAKVLGREVPRLDKAHGLVFVDWPGAVAVAGQAVERAYGLAFTRGAALVGEVVLPGDGLTEADLRRLLGRQGRFAWLDEPAGWFTLAQAGQSLPGATVCAALAAAGGRIGLGELYDRLPKGKMPAELFRAFCGLLSWSSVEGDEVVAFDPVE